MKLLFFDTETTGLPKDWKAPVTDSDNWPRCIELAWIMVTIDDDKMTKEELAHIISPDGFEIPQEASAVHGITTELATEKGVSGAEVFTAFHQAIESADFICGHNIAFDMNILNAEFHRLGLSLFIEEKKKPQLCTMQSGRRYSPNGKWPKLGALYETLFGEPFKDAHRASADIAGTYKCFNQMVMSKDIVIDGITPNESLFPVAPWDEADAV